MTANQQLGPTALRIIRIALTSGVLAFGLVVAFLLRSSGPGPLAPDAERVLRIGFLVVALVSIGIMLVLRRAQEAAADFPTAARHTIVAWALAEGLAIFGGVIYMLTSNATLYIVGTIVLIVSFVIVPIPAERAG